MTTSATELTAALHALPQEWALTLVKAKKPYKSGWQKEGLDRETIAQEINLGHADGFGLLTGELSTGLLAIDCDGAWPHERLREILGGEIPSTVSFASGKADRAQYLFSVPAVNWSDLKTHKEGKATAGGQLEFRWNGCQSVLPPSAHPETDGYKWNNSPDATPISPIPNKLLDYLLAKTSPNQPVNQPQLKPINQSGVPPIPLGFCISRLHQEYLAQGVGKGSRHDAAVALAKDLIGCANALDAIFEVYEGDPYEFLCQFGERCEPPMDPREIDSIWRSIDSSVQPANQDPDHTNRCLKYWRKDRDKQKKEELSGYEPDDSDKQDDIEDLHRLLSISDYDPVSGLSEPLRSVLAAEAARWSLPTLVYVVSLLTTVLSVCKVDTSFQVLNTKARPVLWTGLVGTSNAGKSESLATITDPLEALQSDATEEYDRLVEAYGIELKKWETAKRQKADDGLEEPVKPVCREYYLSDFTYEAIGKTIKPQKHSCILVKLDELKPFFAFDRYTNGGGNRARYLPMYDGRELKSNRKGDERLHISKTGVNIIGTIQYSTLANMLAEDTSLEDGLWARFSLINLPTTKTYAHEPDSNGQLFNILKRVYAEVSLSPAFNLTASPAAKAVWADWYNEMVDKADSCGTDFLASIYGKAKDRAARIAMALHILNAVVDRTIPAAEISAETMAHAIAINKCLLTDTEKCLGLVGVTTDENHKRVMKFVARFSGQGWIDSLRTKKWWSAKDKPKRQECRDFMKSVVDCGLAEDNELVQTDPKYQVRVLFLSNNIVSLVSQHSTPQPVSIPSETTHLVPVSPNSPFLSVNSPENEENGLNQAEKGLKRLEKTNKRDYAQTQSGEAMQPKETKGLDIMNKNNSADIEQGVLVFSKESGIENQVQPSNGLIGNREQLNQSETGCVEYEC